MASCLHRPVEVSLWAEGGAVRIGPQRHRAICPAPCPGYIVGACCCMQTLTPLCRPPYHCAPRRWRLSAPDCGWGPLLAVTQAPLPLVNLANPFKLGLRLHRDRQLRSDCTCLRSWYIRTIYLSCDFVVHFLFCVFKQHDLYAQCYHIG